MLALLMLVAVSTLIPHVDSCNDNHQVYKEGAGYCHAIRSEISFENCPESADFKNSDRCCPITKNR